MSRKIQMKRGADEKLPALDVAEFGFTTDTERTLIGGVNGNVELAKQEAVDELELQVKEKVSTVNGIAPIDGNVTIPVPEIDDSTLTKKVEFEEFKETTTTLLAEKVQQVNGVKPDENGNVTIEVPEIDTSKLATKAEVITQITAVAGGHKAFRTLTEVQTAQATLPSNSIVEVTNDGANNGTYQWDGSILTKSAYDPLTHAKSYTDIKLLENDDAVRRPKSTFSINRAYQSNGTHVVWANWYATDYIQVEKGDVVNITTVVASEYPKILVYDSNKTLVNIVLSTISGEQQSFEYSFTHDGYFITQYSNTPLDCFFTINAGKPRFLTQKSNTFQNKADKIFVEMINDFVLGYVDGLGNEIISTTQARTIVYKFLPGTVINFSRVNPSYLFGFNTSATKLVGHDASQWKNTNTTSVTITRDKPYIRFFLRNSAGTALNLSAAIPAITITNSSNVMYERDVDLKIKTRFENTAISDYNSMFRSPSLSSGGVVSFIDDDGKDVVYSELYPFFKNLGVPFGSAIIPTKIDAIGYMTLAQLKEVAADTSYFEVLNHTNDHSNLVTDGITAAQKHYQVYKAKQWFFENGLEATGFVLPYGADNAETRRIIQQYYNSCYDYDGAERVETFDTINNYLISRSNWGKQADRIAKHKTLIDQAVANNGWLVIATHVNNSNYWDADSYRDLTEIINYIKTKGSKILKPRDAFQTFGNIVENDSGFKIQANGKIVNSQ